MNIERIFPSKVSKDFAELMKKEDWRELTCRQLRKDFALSGNFLPELNSSDLNDILSGLSAAIRLSKSKKALWDNLNYRIDIPQVIEPDNVETDELAEIYLLRCFQKVWFRKHFRKKHSHSDNEGVDA